MALGSAAGGQYKEAPLRSQGDRMSPVTLAELDPVTRQRVIEQMPSAEGGAVEPAQMSNLDISDRASLVERLMQLHKGAQQAYTLRDEHRREAGRVLLALRKATPHGEWEPQLKELCKTIGMSRSTAHNYMNSAEKGAVPKHNSVAVEKAKETALRLQDACKKVGMNVDIATSRELGKFHLTYRNLSESEIQQAIDSAAKRGAV
jgi:hypothetical protein